MLRCNLLLLLILLPLTQVWSEAKTAKTITVPIDVGQLEHHEGQLTLTIFSSEATHLKEGKEWKIIRIDLSEHEYEPEQTLRISFDAPAGDYSMGIYHDRNKNGKIDSSWTGIPREPYGWSNRVHPKWSKPSWKATRFIVEAEMKPIEVVIKPW